MANEVQTEAVLAKGVRRKRGEFEFLRLAIDGQTARITLNRPEHNLLNEQMLRELAACIQMVVRNRRGEADRSGRLGKGVFCAASTSESTQASGRFRCWTLFTRLAWL